MSNDRDGVQASQAGTQAGERFTFAQIPLVMRKDPMLEPIDIPVTMFILPWMKGRPYGWTTVDMIATGVDASERTVQRSLARLRKAGWFGVERSNFNATRREFHARWMTDDGFESLASRLGIDSWSDHRPRLVYSPRLEGGTQVSPKEYDASRSFQLHLVSEDSPMDLPEQHHPESPCETALNARDLAPDDPEIARNAAAIERGVPALFPSRLPRASLGCAVNSIGRLVARNLDDMHSVAFHYSTLWRVVDGDLSPQTYMEAYRTAMGEVVTREGEPIRKRGARFVEMIKAMENRFTEEQCQEEWASQHGLATA